MKKTGLEIVEMIAKGKAPKKIKEECYVYIFKPNYNYYELEDGEEFNILNNLNKEFEIIEENKVWKPKQNEIFYYIEDLKVKCSRWGYGNNYNELYELGNCFRTEEEAQKVLYKIKIYARLKRYAKEHNTEKIDWNNRQQVKWFAEKNYNSENNYITCLSTYNDKVMNQVYFTSRGICERAIKEIGEDNIKKLFED